MKRISSIGGLLKKIYRVYNNQLLTLLQEKGFTDLRPSFLEILVYVCENQGPSIKDVGNACGLKKQTMTSHLNELQKRGYIIRKAGEADKREIKVFLTDYGERFKFSLFEALESIEADYSRTIGDLELDRINSTLDNMHQKMTPVQEDTLKSRIQLNLSLDF
ncbi:MarR family winged helix-turn-helix transcriptional regulator [Bacteriovorax sp. DB6_IX]|uniref:MarR family winged helix-turn-helix transcriptional regulator n=1 Tax=Bacteriovorax sp. DB6_IX TaxID=1353530 RepID=UPI000389F9C0|nr:MarR family transcriptional regulator [Bacteriovorax sp. DB6_IX]EQC49649.1 MarR family protein [Bacteriovorax sp. DB6_IX]